MEQDNSTSVGLQSALTSTTRITADHLPVCLTLNDYSHFHTWSKLYQFRSIK